MLCSCLLRLYSVHVTFTGTVSSESVDMLLFHLQSNEACNYAYSCVIFSGARFLK